MEKELKQCPNCNSETGPFVQKVAKNVYHVKCHDCSCTSNYFKDKKLAIYSWNEQQVEIKVVKKFSRGGSVDCA